MTKALLVLGLVAAGLLLGMFLSGCVTVGKGKRTLIKAVPSGPDAAAAVSLFPHLLVSDAAKRVVPLSAGGETGIHNFERFLKGRYGDPPPSAADLSITARNRNAVPAFLPVELPTLPDKLIDFYSEPGKLNEQQIAAIQSRLTALLANVPEMLPRTALHHIDASGRKIYYYYPRVALDFSARLLSPTSLDRFSYLGIAVKLRQPVLEEEAAAAVTSQVRFIDFAPKGADIVEYTRGKLTQAATTSAKTSQQVGRTSKKTATAAESSTESGASSSLGAELSISLSETYVNELKDAIERQASGILDGGQTFFSELRSIKDKRIGGTYPFDLMLEVPAYGKPVPQAPELYESVPATWHVAADVYTVGVVRHVHDRGMTGVRVRIPEPDNDDTYEQVVYERIGNVVLWDGNKVPWSGREVVVVDLFSVKVFSNHDNAQFVVVNQSGAVIGTGKGQEAVIDVTPDDNQEMQAHVEFLPIVATSGDGAPVTLTAADSPPFRIPANAPGNTTVVGIYQAKSR